jgi:hypothetical protein
LRLPSRADLGLSIAGPLRRPIERRICRVAGGKWQALSSATVLTITDCRICRRVRLEDALASAMESSALAISVGSIDQLFDLLFGKLNAAD